LTQAEPTFIDNFLAAQGAPASVLALELLAVSADLAGLIIREFRFVDFLRGVLMPERLCSRFILFHSTAADFFGKRYCTGILCRKRRVSMLQNLELIQSRSLTRAVLSERLATGTPALSFLVVRTARSCLEVVGRYSHDNWVRSDCGDMRVHR
jgi:hypothetical protein